MLLRHRHIALATALAGLLALPVLAQNTPMPASGEAPSLSAQRPAEPGQRKQWRQERMQKHHAQRMAGLKEKLQINPAQESSWQAFAQAMQPPQPPQQALDREEWSRLKTPERIDRMRTLRSERNAQADRRAEAIKTFYATLNPEQQQRFDQASQRMHGKGKGERQGREGGHGRHGHHGGGMMY
ncbi:MAG: Spy/CpxP family protein refolding chaperone [Giesbergeria sp.]